MFRLEDYPFEIRRMTEDEGSGYMINFPDFNECFSDGETVDEAIENGMDALKATILALEDTGFPVPTPGSCQLARKDQEPLEATLRRVIREALRAAS